MHAYVASFMFFFNFLSSSGEFVCLFFGGFAGGAQPARFICVHVYMYVIFSFGIFMHNVVAAAAVILWCRFHAIIIQMACHTSTTCGASCAYVGICLYILGK